MKKLITEEIVLFGGSFNPPHKPHRRIAKILAKRFDRVFIIPCGAKHKASTKTISAVHRMEMVKIAFKDILKIEFDFYDLENNVYTPTYLLEERYKELFPTGQIWHVIGEDIVAGGCNKNSEIHKIWDHGNDIWNNLNFLVIVRPGYGAHHEDLPPKAEIMEIGDIIGSGTLIRKRIENNKPISDLVDPDVEEYIKRNGLYQKNKFYGGNKLDHEIEVLIGIFKEFKGKVLAYKYPEELFGELKGNSTDDRLVSLKEKFKKLLQNYSADKYNHYNNQELFDLASDIQKRILELEKMAEEQIYNGTYGTKNNSAKNISVISVGNREYRISELIVRGDFVDIFSGEFGNGGNVEPVLVKMARNTDDDGYLLDGETIKLNNDSVTNEAKVLKYLDSIKDADFQKVRPKHYPILLDKFGFRSSGDTDTDTEERQALVLKYFDGYDFIVLREKFENGVPLYHVCWMMERALSAIGYLNFNKILLGNIIPAGIYVIPQDHNVIFGDYTFSVMDYTSKQAKYIGFTENFTAPEVIKNAKPHPRSDLYSLGKNIVYVLGGNIEKNTLPDSFEMISGQKVDMDSVERIRHLILSFINKHPQARYDDAWKAYHQLRDLRKDAFGEAKFIEFKIPE